MKPSESAHKPKPVPQQPKPNPETKVDRARFERARKALYEYWKLKWTPYPLAANHFSFG